MRIAYFDCYSGISGDMILGALVDLGVDLSKVKKGLKAVDLKGYQIKTRSVKRGLISGTKVDVIVPKSKHHHHSRTFSDIKKLLRQSRLPGSAKTQATEIFRRIAVAESQVHRIPVDKVHFHEVGAVDSIVDIVGGVLAIQMLDVDRIYSSSLNVGEGTVKCDHGILPVPAPATLKLLKGIPCFSNGIQKELTTPTGAAIIGFFAEKFRSLPCMKMIDSGYGAGDHILKESPNFLRIILGEIEGEGASGSMITVETNIDDMNPEFYDHVMESLFKAGAVDVFFTPILMKKNRPAVKLSVLTLEKYQAKIARVLLTETSTFGVRFYPVDRVTLMRETRMVKTVFGNITIKVGLLDGAVARIAPEYDECKKIARRKKIPIKAIYDEAVRQGEKLMNKNKEEKG